MTTDTQRMTDTQVREYLKLGDALRPRARTLAARIQAHAAKARADGRGISNSEALQELKSMDAGAQR